VQFSECAASDCSSGCLDVINLASGVCYSPPKLNFIGFVVECEYEEAVLVLVLVLVWFRFWF
jgi:hypothetical protein